jgi:hypothetical protein
VKRRRTRFSLLHVVRNIVMSGRHITQSPAQRLRIPWESMYFARDLKSVITLLSGQITVIHISACATGSNRKLMVLFSVCYSPTKGTFKVQMMLDCQAVCQRNCNLDKCTLQYHGCQLHAWLKSLSALHHSTAQHCITKRTKRNPGLRNLFITCHGL